MLISIRNFLIYSWVYSLWFVFVSGAEAISPILKHESEYCMAAHGSSLDCGEKLDDQSAVELAQMYKDQVQGYFMGIIFENASCRCGGNTGCTRGCRLASYLSEAPDSTIRQCIGRKSIRRSRARCTQHTTGALMAVIHDLLTDYCKSTEDRILWASMSYQECDDNFNKDVKNNNISICRHGFKFPHALCMLNLDGQSRHLYDKISDRGIRSECKGWDQYNQSLLSVDASFDNEEIRMIPLFKKISPERNKEFQKDPNQIPTGAIIVTKFFRRSGHVEVKTDRNECGASKTQTCFCSDYCREREKYYYPVLAVFEWNPEFIKYVSANRYLGIEAL